MLTRKQYELLRFIHERLKEAGVPPSFDEMKDALDLRSKSGIHRLITALEERGFIRRLPNRARAIEVIKLPDPVGHGTVRRGFTPVACRMRRASIITALPAPLSVAPVPVCHESKCPPSITTSSKPMISTSAAASKFRCRISGRLRVIIPSGRLSSPGRACSPKTLTSKIRGSSGIFWCGSFVTAKSTHPQRHSPFRKSFVPRFYPMRSM